MGFQNGQRHEEDELVAIVIGPSDLPKSKNVIKGELSFEGDENPSGVDNENLQNGRV